MNSAAATMRELQKKVDLIANNIANVNTNGYKRSEASFSDTLIQSIERQAQPQHEVGRDTPYGLRIGSGAKLTGTSIRTEQGSIVTTNRPLDFMIQGENGFFRVETDGNTRYTKNGAFQLQPILNSNDVRLVTSSGDSVLDNNNQPITFPGDYDTIQVNENGMVQVTYKNSTTPPLLFQLSLATINRPNSLEKVGGNLYQLPGTEADQIANGTLQLAQGNEGGIKVIQGALEMSNVNLTDEMTELISTQRLIQSQGRAISMADDMMGLVNSMRG